MSVAVAISPRSRVVYSNRLQLRALFDRFGPMVYRRCMALLGNHHDAEEATQEVFVRAMKAGNPTDGPASSWLYRIATNYCFNQIRDRKRRDELWQQHGANRSTAANPAPANLLLVQKILDSVDEQCGLAALYVYVDGMSHREASELMDVSRRTVGNLLVRFERAAAELLGTGETDDR